MGYEICSVCNGSGEGMADGTTCWHCRGKGVEWVEVEEEEEDEDNVLDN